MLIFQRFTISWISRYAHNTTIRRRHPNVAIVVGGDMVYHEISSKVYRLVFIRKRFALAIGKKQRDALSLAYPQSFASSVFV